MKEVMRLTGQLSRQQAARYDAPSRLASQLCGLPVLKPGRW